MHEHFALGGLEDEVDEVAVGDGVFFDFTGSASMVPAASAAQLSASGQMRQRGERGVHWMAPKSMMAWL